LTAKTCKKFYLQQLDGSHAKFSHLEAILIQSMKQKVKSTASSQHGVDRCNISHKNQEISNLTIKKNQARLTLQLATENSKKGKTKQRTKDQETKTEKDLKTK
jgi:hypothetical protein